MKRQNELLRLAAKEMAARPSRLQQSKAGGRAVAPLHGSTGGGTTGVGSREGGGRFDEGYSQRSSSLEETDSLTLVEAVS